jgi:hypothetical protein
MKIRWVALFLVVVFFAAWYSFFGGAKQAEDVTKMILGGKSVSEQKIVLEEKYGSMLISYSDPEFGFKIRYPLGYEAFFLNGTDLDPRVRFLLNYPDSSSLVVDVRAGTESLEQITDSIFGEYTREEFPKKESAEISGRRAVLIKANSTSEFTDERIFFKHAIYDCGAYRVYVNALIPEMLSPEGEVIDLMLYSFEC